MDSRWIATTCIVLIAVPVTSILFIMADIIHYFNVIEIMVIKIQHAIRFIIILLLILFFSILVLLRNN